MKHLPTNKKYKLTMEVLRGKSYAQAGRDFNIPESTARNICAAFFEKCFLPTELMQIEESERNLTGYRRLMKKSTF